VSWPLAVQNMQTLKDLIIATKSRKGPAAGTDKRGAYWLVREIRIRSYGGDGIGQNASNIRNYLQLKHYRSGEVRAVVIQNSWHQNYGDNTSWHGVNGILDSTTVEEVICVLLNSGDEEFGVLYESYFEEELTEMLTELGLPRSLPSPDEDIGAVEDKST